MLLQKLRGIEMEQPRLKHFDSLLHIPVGISNPGQNRGCLGLQKPVINNRADSQRLLCLLLRLSQLIVLVGDLSHSHQSSGLVVRAFFSFLQSCLKEFFSPIEPALLKTEFTQKEFQNRVSGQLRDVSKCGKPWEQHLISRLKMPQPASFKAQR